MTWVVYILLMAVVMAYVIMLLIYTFQWKSLPSIRYRKSIYQVKVSVIVPARNEQNNIQNCLEDIIRQSYPRELLEVIVADDHSIDLTVEKVEEFISENRDFNIRILQMKQLEGKPVSKKKAIAEAVQIAEGGLIVTTDADCRMGSHWLESMAAKYEKEQPKMILGPVMYHKEINALEKMQSLEFSGYVAVSGGTAHLGHPIMCNGANLAFEKAAFEQVNGYKGTDDIPSGDDVFLMLKINKTFPGKVHYLKSKEAIVFTKPQPTIKDIIHQRKRWLSKKPGYTDKWVTGTAWLVFFTNLSVFVSFILAIVSYPKFGLLALSLFVLKSVGDFYLLYSATKFFRRKNLLWWFLPEQFLIVFYVTLMGILGTRGSYNWKDREVKIK